MSKLRLWQYAMFRWCVYVAPLLVFGLFLKFGAFDFKYHSGRYSMPKGWSYITNEDEPYEIYDWKLGNYALDIWIIILLLPAVWVWRKAIWSCIKLGIVFLNNLADGTGSTIWNYQKAVVVLLLLIAFFTGWIAFNLELVTSTYDAGYGAETRIQVWN